MGDQPSRTPELECRLRGYQSKVEVQEWTNACLQAYLVQNSTSSSVPPRTPGRPALVAGTGARVAAALRSEGIGGRFNQIQPNKVDRLFAVRLRNCTGPTRLPPPRRGQIPRHHERIARNAWQQHLCGLMSRDGEGGATHKESQ